MMYEFTSLTARGAFFLNALQWQREDGEEGMKQKLGELKRRSRLKMNAQEHMGMGAGGGGTCHESSCAG